jgi:hypothetical protein
MMLLHEGLTATPASFEESSQSHIATDGQSVLVSSPLGGGGAHDKILVPN